MVVTQDPAHGTLRTDTTGKLVYTPDEGFTGTDTFFYSAAQPENASMPAQVTITVGEDANTAPQAVPDTLVTPIDTPLLITAEDLLGNDTDTDGDGLTFRVLSDPAAGSLVDNGDGTLTYTPEPGGFVGPVSFAYHRVDGEADSIPALVTIDVGGLGPNVPPVAGDDYLSTAVDTPLTILPADLFGNDVDPDGDSSLVTAELIALPAHGSLVSADGFATYTPDPGFSGVDSFTYQVEDDRDLGNIATVYITVGEPNAV
ncbi:tandem-95 repeat protein [Mycolicibacterium vaccae]|nr:tandem-95 repeat protein [Mycolicibacterium vaccae]